MRASAWGLLALLLGCDGAFGPKAECFPVSCDQLGRNCDPIDDGCGHMISCGECPAGQICGLSIRNVCGTPPPTGCTPSKTCISEQAQCGSIDDGCGTPIDCPNTCGAAVCGANGRPNQCSVCAPPACAPPGIGCGMVTNACNQTVDCGPCPLPQKCGLQVANICSCPPGASCEPVAPTLFLAGVAWDRVDLAWADSDSTVIAFEVQRSVNGGPFSVPISVGNAHRAPDPLPIVPGTSLEYQVRVSAPATGPWSNAVTAVVPFHESAWRTLGANSARTSYNSAETARPPGTLRWEQPFDAGGLEPVVSEPPLVYAIAGSSLSVFDFDGGVSARYPLPGVACGQPALFGGQLFVGCDLSPMPGEYLALDLSGMVRWSAPFAASSAYLLAPLSTGDSIVAVSANATLLLQLDQANGHLLTSTTLPATQPWVPALSHGVLYAYAGGLLQIVDVATGEPSAAMPLPGGMEPSPGWASVDGDTVVLPLSMPAGIAVWTNGQLNVMPVTASGFMPAAVADGQIYVATPDLVAKFDEANLTSVTWTSFTDGGLVYPPIVAAGFVYVSSDTTVFALDVSNGQKVWTASPGGWLSIAGGMLFVASPDRLRAYALTP